MFETLRRDIQSFFDRDPAARSVLEVILCYPGLHVLWFYRLSHWLWGARWYVLARWISQWGRFFTGIEIHPGAKIGHRLVIDHGMGTVIGETAEIGDDVTLYHNVTLGGVTMKKERRHPLVEDHVVIGAGAQILGPIRIGAHSRIGANAVVVKDVPSESVVIGVPGRIQSRAGVKLPERGPFDLEHNLLPDTTMNLLEKLTARVAALEAELAEMHASKSIARSDNSAGTQDAS